MGGCSESAGSWDPLLRVVRSMHDQSRNLVQIAVCKSSWFPVHVGLQQKSNMISTEDKRISVVVGDAAIFVVTQRKQLHSKIIKLLKSINRQ